MCSTDQPNNSYYTTYSVIAVQNSTTVLEFGRWNINYKGGEYIKRATQEQILNRRKDMLYYDRLGLRPVDWIPNVAEKYGCSLEAVKKDWAERKRWMQTYLKIDDVENMALDILLDYEISLNDTRKLYDEAKDVKTKIQTLWLRFKAIQMKMDYLKELGALGKIKSEFTITNSLYSRNRDEEVYPLKKKKREMFELLDS